MARVRINTTIDDKLLNLLKERASIEGVKNVNVVLEKALKFYFANLSVSVWERECPGGWTRKLIIRPDVLILENIRSRKSTTRYERAYYTNDAMLTKDGWRKVWSLKAPSQNTKKNDEINASKEAIS
jgi:hypothetical protein